MYRLIIFTLTIGGIMFFFGKKKTPQNEAKKILAKPKPNKDPDIEEKIKKIIDNFFSDYREKQINYTLYNDYGLRFTLELPKLEQEPDMVLGIGNLYELNIEESEIQIARSILKEKIHSITGKDVSHLRESPCLSFLLDYEKLQGEKIALGKIKDQLPDEEIRTKLSKELEQQIENLKEQLKNSEE